MALIILMRHGETTKDKSSPDRALSELGIEQLKSRAEHLKGFISGKQNIKILHTDTTRARQSAEILAEKWRENPKINLDCQAIEARLNNIDYLAREIIIGEERGRRPAQTYLSKYSNYPKVEKPNEFFERMRFHIQTCKGADVVVIISHECSLEAFMEGAKTRYKVFESSLDKYFDYADYAILQD